MHYLIHMGQQYVLQFDLIVLHGLAVAVGTHKLQLGLWNGLAHRAVLHEDRRGEVGQFGERQGAMLAMPRRVATRRRYRGDSGLCDTPMSRGHFNPA